MSEQNLHNKKGTTFKCPKCQKAEIRRTGMERMTAQKYTCPNCGFTGPN